MNKLLSVDTALTNILETIAPIDAEHVSLDNALGRVIAEDVTSNVNLPPFDNSAMDGYAIRFEDVEAATKDSPATLQVVMDIPAGIAPNKSLNKGQAARIMTGAPVPEGATAVVPVEETTDSWQKGDTPPLPETVGILTTSKHGANIRKAGENIRVGGTVIESGTKIRPAEIGMLAAVGASKFLVFRRPRVVILTTGDELVDVDQDLAPGKIRDTNSHTLAGLISEAGGIPIRLPIASDNMESIRNLYETAIDQKPDMIISSAGVSVGTADLVKVVMEELGNIDFWRINIRPGKPLAYGTIKSIPFFGLPGNPVSAMVTFEVFVRPALAKMSGTQHIPYMITATLADDMKSDGRKTFNRVTLKSKNGQYIASTTGIQSSGALMSMVRADGLIVIPEDMTFVPAGTELSVLILRPIS